MTARRKELLDRTYGRVWMRGSKYIDPFVMSFMKL
jgi:hypothetical protein